MGYKLSPKEFEKMLKNNKHIKVNDSFGEDIQLEDVDLIKQIKEKNVNNKNHVINDNSTIEEIIGKEKTNKEKVVSGLTKTYNNVYESLEKSIVEYEIIDDSLIIVFYGAKLFSRNQTDSLKEQKPHPFRLSKYKKLWETKTNSILETIFADVLSKKIILPNFKGNKLRLYLYRQITKGQKLYDEDNLTTSFKYFIDGLRKKINIGGLEWQLIEDDNQTIINECVPFQVKGEKDMVAIRILIGSNKPVINSYDEFKKLR